MALNKALLNPRQEEVSYWKIARYSFDAIQDKTEVVMYGFADRADRDNFLSMPKDTKGFSFGRVESIADCYTAIKATEEFIDAEDC